tara:strand:- start:33 stop:392 length:360 start_codon:yes stop_codon:yes gene_type:complete
MRVLLDRFPCHLVAIGPNKIDDVTTMRSYEPTEGSTYLEITRVIVTEEHIIVAKDGTEGPQIVFRETYEEFIPSEKAANDSFVVTSSGKMIAFKKDTGCGCGSRLRGWNPYGTLNSIKD